METLEQRRAQHAWKCSQGCSDEYMKLAKGLPALIMNSGLMQVMAFLHEKGEKQSQRHCRDLAQHMRDWLHRRFPDDVVSDGFEPFMQTLLHARPDTFQRITAESFAWLRWLRQMTSAARSARS